MEILVTGGAGSIAMSNKNTYEANDVVKSYSLQTNLQKPEETILNNFKSRLKNMKMLDIGVGGGRTTYHFANLAKEYIGTDYSQKMIISCKKKFPNSPKNISFRLCDVRSMDIFKNNYFDFILFSYNGLDYMSHEDRLRALNEIKIVCKSGGFFCFSTHNINAIESLFSEKLFTIQLCLDPFKILRNILQQVNRFFLLRLRNEPVKKLKSKKYAIINDGAQRFRLKTYYIKPQEQIKQLRKLGFKNIKVYSLSHGKEIKDKSKLETIEDSWLYYLCNK